MNEWMNKNVYSAVIIARVHSVHVMNATNTLRQKPTNLSCESMLLTNRQ